MLACAHAAEDTAVGANDLSAADGGAHADAAPIPPDAPEGATCRSSQSADVRACQRGLSCTYAWHEDHGTCAKPGTEGGLCGSTYADFAGGDCAAGLRCAIGEASFPSSGILADSHGYAVGRCEKSGVAGAACSTAYDADPRLACDRGLACTYAYGATRGVCRSPGAEGGLCGGTYADFAGGTCADGRRCALGEATFPAGASSEPARQQPDGVGVCKNVLAARTPCTIGTAVGASTSLSCPAGLACTYAPHALQGECREAGTEGGLCGGTYADFPGGVCETGLRCVYGAASYPSTGGAAEYAPGGVGLCAR